jgi:hypothetical protein
LGDFLAVLFGISSAGFGNLFACNRESRLRNKSVETIKKIVSWGGQH